MIKRVVANKEQIRTILEDEPTSTLAPPTWQDFMPPHRIYGYHVRKQLRHSVRTIQPILYYRLENEELAAIETDTCT